jgi:hypothetical protein
MTINENTDDRTPSTISCTKCGWTATMYDENLLIEAQSDHNCLDSEENPRHWLSYIFNVWTLILLLLLISNTPEILKAIHDYILK